MIKESNTDRIVAAINRNRTTLRQGKERGEPDMTDLLPKNLANSPERLEVDVSLPKPTPEPEVKVDVNVEEPGKTDDDTDEKEES